MDMHYYEVMVADGRYHSDAPLTYSSEKKLPAMSIVTVPLRQRNVTGFVTAEVAKPAFEAKPIKAMVSERPLPAHCLALASWLSNYYTSTLAEALRQFAPSRPTVRRKMEPAEISEPAAPRSTSQPPLTADQLSAIKEIEESKSTTILLHGETGSGKTRVYLELAKKSLVHGKSVILLTPEISLTSQLVSAVRAQVKNNVYVLHSRLSEAERKKIWFQILETDQPAVIIGPRSALFTPLAEIGLIVLDEAHEPAYKQDQSPYYHAARVASQLGKLTGAKVILGTATPSISDYYLAEQRAAVVRMTRSAVQENTVKTLTVDLKDRSNFSRNNYLSDLMIDVINTTLSAKKQVMIYLNRRGSARVILCFSCGWRLECPNCDVSMVYHGDEHLARCHICGYRQSPPVACPQCGGPEVIYRSIGTKALAAEVAKLFPEAKVQRFDSDNTQGEQLQDVYHEILDGSIDILVGTQLLAKGLDLPRLGLVGVINAESSLGLPDFTAEERAFQLLYQITGRVGRGHGDGEVIVQSYDPNNLVICSALKRDWLGFYDYAVRERRQFKFPPFSYLLQLTCKRATSSGAQTAADRLKAKLLVQKLPVEIIGPTPSFYARRGKSFYYQLVVKSKDRSHLLKLAQIAGAGWQINIDPTDLL